VAAYSPSWACTSSHDGVLHRQRILISTREKVVGKPYRGKPDVRFDEGT
jgi:hypothetical protein